MRICSMVNRVLPFQGGIYAKWGALLGTIGSKPANCSPFADIVSGTFGLLQRLER